MTTGDPAFFDDFSSGELDRSRWTVRTTGDIHNDEVQAYVDDPDTIAVLPDPDRAGHQILRIQARFRPGFETADGQRFDLVSGRIDTRDGFRFRHGHAAARLRVPAGAGLWPAFWIAGEGAWPDAGEIDVMECIGEPDWVSCAVHGPGYSGEAGLANAWFFDHHTDATDWHTYAVDWSPERIVFSVDDRPVYRVTRPMATFFGAWPFDRGESYLILNLAVGGTYPFKMTGDRTPYHGVSPAAVEAIERGDARLLVDWVRVDGP